MSNSALANGKPSANVVANAPDRRRITEQDPDFLRVRAYWQRKLVASVRELQRDIQRGGEHAIGPAQSAFIHRHIQLLRQAYLAGHAEGQRDYWSEVSLQPQRWARARRLTPAESLVQRRLLFYGAASVVKLAREVATVWRMRHTIGAQAANGRADHGADHGTRASSTVPTSSSVASVASSVALADPPAGLEWDKFTAWAAPRIGLQADVTWSAFQDGYLDAATADQAGLQLVVFWDLEPGAEHCDDCPQYAAGSPYTAPGSGGSGGNELNATPGDGHTACGAACKCGLRYAWINLRGSGATAAENELVLAPGETPPHAVPPGWNVPPIELPQRPTGEAIQPLGALRPELQLPGVPPIELPQRPAEPDGAQQITDLTTVNGATTVDFALATTEQLPQPLDGLTDGQKQALDDVRGIALLWDAIRGSLPNFETYFDPGSVTNLWQNRTLAGLDQAQQELVARYFKALGDFQDASPIDE